MTFLLYRDLVDRTIVVPEPLIASAMALLFERHHKMAEGAGALPLAGLLARPGEFSGRNVVLVVSGRNIAPDRFRAATGLALE